MKEQYAKELEEKDAIISNISTMKEQYTRELEEKDAIISNIKKEKLIINNGEHNIVNSIKDNIKKKYIKKELEIYKNENISLKNQIEFFKNMLMMNNMFKMNDYPHSSSSIPSVYQHHHQRSPPSPSLTPQIVPSILPFQQTGDPHRSNVKTAEQPKSINNENQHKNKMGSVLEQLQQLQKQKQKQSQSQ